jgi:hypothetical protein
MRETTMRASTTCQFAAAIMIVAFGAHRLFASSPLPGADKYHARVRAQAAAEPLNIGPWVGQPVAVPSRASRMLQPNVIISRRYLNVEDGQSAGFLLVHCSNAHHMAGHFPLRCYPAEGWTLRSSHPQDYVVGSLVLRATEYEFTMDAPGRTRSMTVINCLLLPGGKVVRDMNEMVKAVVGVSGQNAGAGQIQVYFDGIPPEAQRAQTLDALVTGHSQVLAAILADPSK